MLVVGISYYIIKINMKIKIAITREPINEPTAIPAIAKFESPFSDNVGVGDEVENTMLAVLGVLIELDNVDESVTSLKRKI